ncbi:tetratricopeptide repeat protein, partial [Amylibacter sp.]|nr:tetratricopeptide repeat protein [Amylibacter sp.]
MIKNLILAALLTFSSPTYADFASGNAAAERGDFKQAFKLWVETATAGDAKSQNAIGALYANGDGIPKNEIEAIRWFSMAAKQGYSHSQYNLARMYEVGAGTTTNLTEAIKWYQLAADQGHRDSLLNLGILYAKEGKFSDAEPLLIRYLIISKNAVGSSHPNIAAGSTNLANIYIAWGRYADAEALLKNSLLINKKHLGELHPDFATAQMSLGLLYFYQERHAESEEYLKRSLLGFENAFGPEHPAIARALNNLAMVYSVQSKYEEAEPLYKRSLLILEKALGLEHPQISNALNNLALIYFEQGRDREAEPLYMRSLLILEDAFGSDNLLNSTPLLNLGALYLRQGRHTEAEFSLKRSLKIQEKAFGPEHPSIGTTRMNLAILYKDQGRYELSELLFKNVLRILDKALDPENSKIAAVMGNLANLYMHQQRYSDAKLLLERSLEINKEAFGANHPNVIKTLVNLAILSNLTNKHSDGLQYLNQALDIIKLRVISYGDLKTGKASEQELNQPIFAFHIDLTLKSQESFNSKSSLSKAFESGQLAIITEAGTAIQNIAQRFSTGDPKIGNLVRQRQDLTTELKKLETRLTKFIGLQPDQRDTQKEGRLKNLLNEKIILVADIDEKLATSFPRFVEFSQNRPLPLVETQKLLDKKEALFLTLSSGKATYAFFVTKDDVRAYEIDLSESDIAAIVGELRAGIDLSNTVGFGDLPNFDMDFSYDLYSKLFGPVEDMLESVKHLLVVPTGPLESLPLNLLITEKPKMDLTASAFENYQAAAWLPKTFSLTRLPSVSSLRALRVFASQGRSQEPFIGFGDPVLDGPAGDLRGLTVEDVYQGGEANIAAVRNLPELPETSEELKRIAAYLGAPEDKVYLRERASETVLKNTDLTN